MERLHWIVSVPFIIFFICAMIGGFYQAYKDITKK